MLISALIVNVTHGYLLVSQRDDRKSSISSHATHSKQTYVLYLIAHLLGGFFFIIFAYKFFVIDYNTSWIFVLAVVTVFFEYLQAFIPYKGKSELMHGMAAYGMWLFYLIVGYAAIINLPLRVETRLIALPFLICPIILGIYANYHRQKMYWLQMIIISSFCIGMLIIATGK